MLALIQAWYSDAGSETFYLPVAVRLEELVHELSSVGMGEIVAALDLDSGPALMYDALSDQAFCSEVVQLMERSDSVTAKHGIFRFDHARAAEHGHHHPLSAAITSVKRVTTEQSNSSVIYSMAGQDPLIMKSFRRIENGANPDFEVCHFLTTRTHFRYISQLIGYANYEGVDGFTATIAALQRFIVHAENGWDYTIERLKDFYRRASLQASRDGATGSGQAVVPKVGTVSQIEVWETTRELTQEYVKEIATLGQVTAELHAALASDGSDPSFRPEPITQEDVASWIGAMRHQLQAVMQMIRQRIPHLPETMHASLFGILRNEDVLERKLEDLHLILEARLQKARCHGDYHLGQVLKTKREFVILDFEGEPARPLTERRAKQTPLKDVAGMLRSFNYAAYAGLFQSATGRSGASEELEPWATAWETVVSGAFLNGYLQRAPAADARLVPDSRELLDRILSVYRLDKAVYELNYEANNRPDWLCIPLKGIQRALEEV